MRNNGNRIYVLILTRKNTLKETVNITKTLHGKHSNFSILKEFFTSKYSLEYVAY